MANKTMHHLVIEDNNYEILDAKNRANIAAEYSASSTYKVGDVVLYNGQLYKCTTAITTAEAWTAAHWTAVTVGGELSSVKDGLEDLEETVSQLGGLSDDVKQALLQIASKVAYIDEHGQDYYDALYDALYPPADLVSISAVYTQSGTVYDNQTLDSLKTDLVVTARMSDGTSQTVTTYTLSGTLATGTSTITVAYGGKTATFTVTVSHAETQYSITNTLTNCTNSNSAVAINENDPYSGTLSANAGYVMATVTVVMGNTDITSTAYDSGTGGISISSVTGNIVITASAVEDVGWVSGVPYDMTDGLTNNKYLNQGVETLYNGWAISPYMPCSGAFIISDTEYTINYCAGYDSEDVYIDRANVPANVPFNHDELGFASIRVSDATNKVTGATITPYRLAELSETTAYRPNEYYVPESWFDGGYINVNNGEVVENTGYRYSGFMNCYNASKITDNVRMQARGYVFYDGDKNYISGVEIPTTDGNYNKETTVPTGARYFRCYKTAERYGLCFKMN